jgi:O-antigen ligase
MSVGQTFLRFLIVNMQTNSGSANIANDVNGLPLFLAILAVCLILLGLLLSQAGFPPAVVSVLALLLACIIVPASWPYGALLVLLIASVMPRIAITIGGWNARPEHFASAVVLAAILLRWILRETPQVSLRMTDLAVAAYVVWNYVSSVWMSPDPRSTLRWALLNNLVILPYFLIRFLITDERRLRVALRAFLAVGIVECTYALVAFASRHLLGTGFGTELEYAEGFGGVYGTQYEPNLLGSYGACLAIMLVVLYFMADQKRSWVVGGIVVAIGAVLVSLSRAAFLALLLTGVLLLILGARAGLVNIRRLLPLGLLLCLFVAPFAATGGKNIVSRFLALSDQGVESDSDTIGRLVAWTVALEDIARHPVVGNGTASFQLLADPNEFPILGDRPWVGNSPIRILHDTGAIGLLLMGVVLFGLGKDVRKAMQGQKPGREIVFSLVAGCLIYALTFMSTEGTFLSFFWVHIGLLGCAGYLVAAN